MNTPHIPAADLARHYRAVAARLRGQPSPPVRVKPVRALSEPPPVVEPILEPPKVWRKPFFRFIPDPAAAPQISTAKPTAGQGIRRMVASHYKLTLSEIIGPNRTQRCALPRFAAFYLCARHGGMGPAVIGRLFGDRDHSTVNHGVKMAIRRMIAEPGYAGDIAAFVKQIEAWT